MKPNWLPMIRGWRPIEENEKVRRSDYWVYAHDAPRFGPKVGNDANGSVGYGLKDYMIENSIEYDFAWVFRKGNDMRKRYASKPLPLP